MKRLYLIAIMIIACMDYSYSQVETHYLNNGEASTFINRPIRSTGVVKVMPSFDLAQLEKEDAERDSSGGMFRFGKPFDVSYTLADGQWENVEGGRMWSMTFKSEGALSLNFIFNDFHLPEGAELYVVNKDESVLFGPVTKEGITENGIFLTDIIKGDQASIILFEPTGSEGLSSLTIKRVVHGYRDFESRNEGNRYLYTQDVACYPDYEKASDAVAMILHGNGVCVGTGFLIMSADFSFKPYLLTSYDVVDLNNNGSFSEEEEYLAENSMFKFRYKKLSCGGNNLVTSYTYNQADIRASWNVTKFALLELKGNLKANLTLAWLGWTLSGYSMTDLACIHHPLNDVMKISFYNGAPINYGGSSYLWSLAFNTNGTVYTYSVGAPIIIENQYVIGQISDLLDLNPYSDPNTAHVGQFIYSWNGGATDATGLKHWLNPNNSNVPLKESHRSVGNLQVIGDSVIHTDSSNEFYVSNLPSGLTVTWSISDSYYQGVLEQNEPVTNHCNIDGDPSHEVLNATLTASVYNGTTLVQTASKTVSTQEIFHGTYYNGQTTKQINLPNPLYVLPGTDACITSPNLVGASVSYGGNVTPYTWSFNSSTGVIHVGMPSTGGNTIAIYVTTALGNSFTLYVIRASAVYSMSVGTGLGQISISLVEDENTQSLRDNNPDGLSSTKQVSWILEVFNATTGKKAFGQEIEGTSYSLDTTGWEPGVYIVKATIGDQELTEKVIVK